MTTKPALTRDQIKDFRAYLLSLAKSQGGDGTKESAIIDLALVGSALRAENEKLREALADLKAWKVVIRANLMRIDPTYDHAKFDAEWDEKIASATDKRAG